MDQPDSSDYTFYLTWVSCVLVGWLCGMGFRTRRGIDTSNKRSVLSPQEQSSMVPVPHKTFDAMCARMKTIGDVCAASLETIDSNEKHMENMFETLRLIKETEEEEEWLEAQRHQYEDENRRHLQQEVELGRRLNHEVRQEALRAGLHRNGFHGDGDSSDDDDVFHIDGFQFDGFFNVSRPWRR
ncbi:hypothetical protein K469DRAFT_691734 [Zopfia rhizophila CBS 207.26]|uniref:Uncharacterized protein n=1 Tax=Zopfia rhizophila CBS 207.26 TaxID=1314779 RepID=A0A6A6DPX9_9PEZI|nr:hypothetical protein K469DRAFT_691734 [Zopfia rhizophila CBS 207.26]